jgi:ubiquinone/menaquinone biosynthesis C-methylase UbiE
MSEDELIARAEIALEGARYRSISGEFKHWAPRYHGVITGLMKRYFDVSYDALVEQMAEELAARRPERVLEVGVGTALVASAVARALPSPSALVSGVDVTEPMLEQGRNNVARFGLEGRLELRRAPAEAIPYASATFDAVYSSLCFHHFHTQRALEEKLRVLRPGGRLVILDLGALDVWRTLKGRLYYNCIARVRFFANASHRDEAWATFYTRSEWEKILARFPSLKNVKIEDLSRRTGKISEEKLFGLIPYRSMGTPPLWLITADHQPGRPA